MIDFSNVTDVKIPEGDVVKITEASSGRVLWEKAAVDEGEWYEFTIRATSSVGSHERTFRLLVK